MVGGFRVWGSQIQQERERHSEHGPLSEEGQARSQLQLLICWVHFEALILSVYRKTQESSSKTRLLDARLLAVFDTERRFQARFCEMISSTAAVLATVRKKRSFAVVTSQRGHTAALHP